MSVTDPEPTSSVVGRPTAYKPEFCQQLVDHMEMGYSLEAFAGRIGVTVKTLYNWVDAHPEFLHAKRLGEAASVLFWESLGVQGTMGKIQGFNTAAWIFNMKNRHHWKDRVENTGTMTLQPYIIERRDGSTVELGHTEAQRIEGETDERN